MNLLTEVYVPFIHYMLMWKHKHNFSLAKKKTLVEKASCICRSKLTPNCTLFLYLLFPKISQQDIHGMEFKKC